MSNNPFVDDSTTAHARFPDLDAAAFQQHYPQQYQYPQPQQNYPPPQPISFQHTAVFQQQQQQQYPISPSYPSPYQPQAQFQPTTPGYLAEFDPYAQTHAQGPSPSQPIPNAYPGTPGPGPTGPAGVSHPRDLIRVHKLGLEAWDAYSWKQLLGACDALREAWSARRQQAESVVRQYGGPDPGLFGPDPAFGYNSQIEGWKQVFKDANDNVDTVAASSFQLQEVFNSYRHSGDQASKRRVRESCNAAVKGLPDWPSN